MMRGSRPFTDDEVKRVQQSFTGTYAKRMGVSVQDLPPETFVFRSRNGENMAISRVQAWRILTAAYQACGLTGKLGTHAMRKSFANVMYERLNGRLEKLQELMGHVSVQSTISYLSFRAEDLKDAVLAA